MADSLIKRAKAFIGLDEEELDFSKPTQMEINSYLKKDFQKSSRKQENADYDIMICDPRVYEDSLNISAYLRQGNAVIVNLKDIEQSEGTRLIDFICGTAFAIDGHMIKIAETIFLFTPSSVAVRDTVEKESIRDDLGLTVEEQESVNA